MNKIEVFVNNRPSDRAVKIFTKILLEIINNNDLYNENLSQKTSK